MKTGGRAFAAGVGSSEGNHFQDGMTMRQYYKAAALVVATEGFDFGRATPEQIAKHAGLIADAMIAEDEAFGQKTKEV